MKKFIALSLLLTTAVHAAEVKVLDIFNLGERQVYAEFKVSKEAGRAWVEIRIAHPFPNQDTIRYNEHIRQKVEGLSFDAATSSIVLERDGQLVECAKVATVGRVFRREKITKTNCQFETKKVTVTVDDGYDVRQVRAHQLSIAY